MDLFPELPRTFALAIDIRPWLGDHCWCVKQLAALVKRGICAACLGTANFAFACQEGESSDEAQGTGSDSAATQASGPESESGSPMDGVVDCSDDEQEQTLSCGPESACCAVSQAANFCGSDCGTAVTFACDGPEDCPEGACCQGTSDAGAGTACTADVTCGSGTIVCTASDQCPDQTPCCFSAKYNGVRISTCSDWDGPGCS